MKEKLLISACFIGSRCKYNGGTNVLDQSVLAVLRDRYDLVPACAEVSGGLPVPRMPAERKEKEVIAYDGRNVTSEFFRGAEKVVRLAEKFGCKKALLKERSPSCGCKQIYDGSFSGKIIKGRGVTAEKLYERGIEMYSENEINELVAEEKRPSLEEILHICDHTLLRVGCTSEEIKELCDQAIKYDCASVCIPPCHVAGAKRYVGDKLQLCTVIGFPNGDSTSAVKAFEAADAIANGADEIDMVINLSMVKDGDWDHVKSDIVAVRKATEGHILKVIIECCLLTDEEKVMMCKLVTEAGADYIKTSTGFSKGGATFDDVKLMRENCPATVKVKAAGGISSIADAEKFMSLGAERLGTSRIVKIAMSQQSNGEY